MSDLNKPKYSPLEVARLLNEVVTWGQDAGEVMGKLPGAEEAEIESAFIIANLEFEIQSQGVTIERLLKWAKSLQKINDEQSQDLDFQRTEHYQANERRDNAVLSMQAIIDDFVTRLSLADGEAAELKARIAYMDGQIVESARIERLAVTSDIECGEEYSQLWDKREELLMHIEVMFDYVKNKETDITEEEGNQSVNELFRLHKEYMAGGK